MVSAVRARYSITTAADLYSSHVTTILRMVAWIVCIPLAVTVHVIREVSRSRTADLSIVRRRHSRCHGSISDVYSLNTVLITIRVSSVTSH